MQAHAKGSQGVFDHRGEARREPLFRLAGRDERAGLSL